MSQIEFLEEIEEIIEKGDINLGTNDAILEIIKSIKEDLEIKYNNQIVKDVTNKDCMHFVTAEYDNWYSFLEDAEMDGNYSYWLRELFEEDELEKLWVDSHR